MRIERVRSSRIRFLGVAPLVWYLLFLVAPLALILTTSFASRGAYGGIEWLWKTENYTRALDPLYAGILLRSVYLAFFTMALSLLIAVPLAWTMAAATARMRSLLVLLLAIPFLTNLVIRICAIKVFTAFDGPLAALLTSLGVEFDPYVLSQNRFLVAFGMISTYLPFMVFPIYGAFERFDFSLIEAARDLGARDRTILWRIVLPILRPALIAGSLLVFVPAMGEFLIPDLLGGAKSMLVGNLISEQYLKARDWPFGSALAVMLMIFVSIVILFTRASEKGREE